MNEYESLNHTKWECKYHVVFIPKYRRKAIYGSLRKNLGALFRESARHRECEIGEGHLMVDHVHMLQDVLNAKAAASYQVITIEDGLRVNKADNKTGAIFHIAIPYESEYHSSMSSKADVWQGTLALMVLKTLERAGSLHGYGIARQIERTSADLLCVNYGTLYPALLKLEQEGCITSEWGHSDNNRKAKFYQLTRAGRKQIEKETQEWEQTTAILARFLNSQIA